MVGIVLTLLAVILVICLAFCHAERDSTRDHTGAFPMPKPKKSPNGG